MTRLWARRPFISVRGQELPKDPQGRYELRDRRGRVRRVEATFDWRQFGPRLKVGDTDVLLGRPDPRLGPRRLPRAPRPRRRPRRRARAARSPSAAPSPAPRCCAAPTGSRRTCSWPPSCPSPPSLAYVGLATLVAPLSARATPLARPHLTRVARTPAEPAARPRRTEGLDVRHRLTPALSEVGGHIGYAVRPSARRRGHATALLRSPRRRPRRRARARAAHLRRRQRVPPPGDRSERR